MSKNVEVIFDHDTNKLKITFKPIELELYEDTFSNQTEINQTIEEIASELEDMIYDEEEGYVSGLIEDFELDD